MYMQNTNKKKYIKYKLKYLNINKNIKYLFYGGENNFNNINIDLNLVDNKNITIISTKSNNGYILKIPYKFNGKIIYFALKCSIQETKITPDNLYYEYYVGKKFINKYHKIFPCFIETYNCYISNIDILKNLNDINLSQNLQIFDDSNDDNKWSKSCTNNKNLYILIEYLTNSKTLQDILPNISIGELTSLLYQVYFVLSYFGNNYTHYDLHNENILLYNINKTDLNYIEMNYYLLNGEIIKFYSQYISKIIDYGRNYFNIENDINSETIYNKICEDKNNCNDCGKNDGYATLSGNISKYFIEPKKPNISHDLRLLYTCNNYTRIYNNIFNIKYNGNFGTPENNNNCEINMNSSIYTNIHTTTFVPTINNIHEAKKYLQILLKQYGTQSKFYNNKLYGYTKTHIMNVYEDGRNYEIIEINDKK